MEEKKQRYTNSLIHSSSPYLLQHACNPVDWIEWSDEAFEKAKSEDKLVLVSIGYSSCHWCHVMAHESFEDEETAKIMNENFICIKVDREERPDIDQIYMDAVQIITGRGGWPLNCILLPDGKPLHGGTYFRKNEWQKILKSLADFYKDNREKAIDFTNNLTNEIKKLDAFLDETNSKISFNSIEKTIEAWKPNFDLQLGGYRWSPKFPMPNNWEMFLQFQYHADDDFIKNTVFKTLNCMADGGIFDHLGGGFARYSTDSYWKVPHFEKMLYDNAQLMSLFSNACVINPSKLYKKTVYKIDAFIENEMTSAEGLFFSAMDADSENEEGKYYVWTKAELQNLLGDDELLFSLYYSVDTYGNWEHGKNILYKTHSDDELEKLARIPIEKMEEIIFRCTTILLEYRSKRTKPLLDDKCITSWNALMIKGYCNAYKCFGDEKFLLKAKSCTDFILANLWIDKTLFRIYKNGKISIAAFAEDYACFCDALLSLYQCTFDEKYLVKANELMKLSIEYFYSNEKNMFHFKSINDTKLIVRKIDFTDDVIPSANSVFAKCLQQLMYYFDDEEYEILLNKMLSIIEPKITKQLSSYSNWMQVLMNKTKGLYQLIVCGENAEKTMKELQKKYLPNAIFAIAKHTTQIPLLKNKSTENKTLIYVCKDKTCGLPFSDVNELKLD